MQQFERLAGNVQAWGCRVSRGVLFALCAISVSHAAMLPTPLQPGDGNTYDLYVADQESYDSNLYRLPKGDVAVGTVLVPNASKEDLYNTSTFGADGQRILGRQVLVLDLRADELRFDRNDTLNNLSYEGHFLWNWVVGGHFSGQAGADYVHDLASFDETRYLGRDLVSQERYFGTARFQLGPRWALYGGVSDTDVNHGAVLARPSDFRSKQGSGGIEFATDVNNTFALQYSYTDGSYPYVSLDTLNGEEFSPNFHDQLTQFLVKYSVSDKTQLSGNVGYIERHYSATNFGSFSGVQWRGGMNWTLTDKTSIVLAGWRELHAYLNSEADFFISKGGSIAPVWVPTEKIQLTMLFSYEDQSFIPQSEELLSTGPLHAKVTTASAAVAYSPRSRWNIRAAVNYQKRDANQTFYAFDDELVQLGVLYKVH